MGNATFIKTKTAESVIPPYRLTKPGSVDFSVVVATAATDALNGSTAQLGAKAASDRVDVAMGGLPEIEFGGVVADQDPLTSDATGRAVKATPAAGANVRIIGFANEAGGVGTIGTYIFAPSMIQG